MGWAASPVRVILRCVNPVKCGPMPEANVAPPPSSVTLSALIGLIYETATDLSLWPRLLEGLAETLAGSAATPMEPGLMACLAPHFLRAHAINQQLSQAEAERDALERVMDRLPLGMAIVDATGMVISMNRALLALTRGGETLRMPGGRLCSQPPEALAGALQQVDKDGAADQILRLAGDAPLSLWVSRLAGAANHAAMPRFLVLAASRSSRALSESGLCDLYGLTQAEARLTQHLALGRTVEEAARALEISPNTAKTHLKRVFAKVGVRRQAELLQAVYASPLWLEERQVPAVPAQETAVLIPSGTGLRLADGRWLAYSDSGDPGGLPLLLMHGIAGSRYLRHPDDNLLLQHGIRLIIPERPGSGDSDPLPVRRIGDWPDDVAALADHLGLGRFQVLGYSAGTPYALATARAMPERVSAVAIVAAMPEIQCLEDLRDYSATFRMSLLVAKYAPSLLPPLLRVMVNSIRRNVYSYIEQSLADASETDRRVFEHPRLRANYAHGLLAGTRRGEHGLALEVELSARDWGFDPAEVRQAVCFWHGESDRLVAPEGARKLAGQLPNSRFETVPGAGHYVLYSHWEAILAGMREAG